MRMLAVLVALTVCTTPAFARHSPGKLGKLEREITRLQREVSALRNTDIWHGRIGYIDASITIASLEPEIPDVTEQPPKDVPEDHIGGDRRFLIDTSCPGYTMHRQGVPLSIDRLNPIFAYRLAAAFREARENGIRPCIFSAYRPPGYGVGGFADKFRSAHSYGLAVDLMGIGAPGSSKTIRWREIAARHEVYGPYGAYSRTEWNHFQPTPIKLVTLAAAALRGTITAAGPVSLERMWRIGALIINEATRHVRRYVYRRRHHVAYLVRQYRRQ